MSNTWISVKDKLPEYTCHVGGVPFACVLICINNTLVSEGLFIDGHFEALGIEVSTVTHWMLLPDPPIIN
jgi:hypothetical protein